MREDINRIAAAHGAGNVRVFGSVPRGEAHDSSDLEDSLGFEVDVVTEGGLSPYLRDRILAEAVVL